MKSAIAGVAPASGKEVTVMTVWPSMASTSVGQFLGRRYSNRFGVGNILTVGNLWALICIPLSLAIYFGRLLPFVCTFYRLTNKRIIAHRSVLRFGWLLGVIPFPAKVEFIEDRAIPLDRFDGIEVEIHAGQEWYPAGDVVFKKGAVETFRLQGILRPEAFRQTCLKARQSHVGVAAALAR